MSRLLKRELKEGEDPSSSSESEDADQAQDSDEKPKRGRPAIPVQWTKVMAIKPDQEFEVKTHSLFVEKELQKHLRRENKPE